MASAGTGARSIQRAAVACLCAEMAAAALVADPAAYQQFSEVKALATYVAALLLLGLLVALILAEGRAAIRWSPLHVPVAALGAAYVAASLFALDRRTALAGADGRSMGLLTVLAMLVAYTGAAVLVPRGAWVLRWIALTVGGIALVTFAVEIGQTLGGLPGEYAGRPLGLAGNPDMLGALMASVAGGAFGVAAAPEAARELRRWGAALGAVGVTGWLLTGTRTPLPGLAVMAIVLATVWAWSGAGARLARLMALGAMSVLAVAAVAISPVGASAARLAGSLEVSLRSGDVFALENNVVGRLDIYRVALEEFAARPVLGVGPDNYVAAYPAYRLPGTKDLHEGYEPQTSTHGWPFKLLTDAGALGVIALISTVVVAVGLSARRWREPWALGALSLLAAWALGALFVPNTVATEWIPWVALGTIAGMSSRPLWRTAADKRAASAAGADAVPQRPGRRARRAAARDRGSRGARNPAPAIVLPVVIAAALAFVPVRSWVASHDAAVARGAMTAVGDAATKAAVFNAKQAVAGDQLQPAYWKLLGQAQHRNDREQEALEAYRRASDLAPYDATALADVALTRARIALARGEGAASDASETARRAVALDPHRPEVYFPLGYALYIGGAYGDAADAVETGAAFQHAVVPAYAYELAARSYLALDDEQLAEDWARRGLADAGGDADSATSFHLLLAQVLAEEGKTEEALKELEIVLQADPSNAIASKLRADLRRASRP